MSDKQMIVVKYSCHTCHITRVDVSVPARGEESVTDWMGATIQLLSDDHRRRSPGCTPIDGKLHEVMIPIEATAKIGGPVVQ